MKYSSATGESGFTLIEVIVTILVVAVFGGMMIVFFSDSIVKSSQSIKKLEKVSDLNKIMAKITQCYNKYPKWRSGTAYAAGAPGNFVVPTVRNGHYYKCTVAGTSYSSEPTSWPTISGGTITETPNIITWTESTENGPLPDLSTVKTSIGAEGSNQDNLTYGKYHVEKNRCVHFLVSDSEQDDAGCGQNILKVTIRSDQGEALTALFLF
jgi:prepilin-type N-terminal cleavage/methylation domain-containing protein